MSTRDDARGNGQGTQGPSVRRRYVRRANTLVNDKAFLKSIADVRAVWNAAFPAYPVTGREVAPQMQGGVLRTIAAMVCPHEIIRGWDRRRRRNEMDDLDDPLFTAWEEWTRLVFSECRRHFPPRYYPNYMGWSHHPAEAFISCCLVYDTKSTPAELIFVNDYAPRHHWFDPIDDDANPTIARLRARCAVLESALRDALGEESEPFAMALRSAADAGRRADHEARNQSPGWPARFNANGDIVNGWWYVPLLPEMTTTDWDNLRAEAIATVKRVHGENPVHDHIRTLYRERMSASKIARLLGVTERHVWKVLGK